MKKAYSYRLSGEAVLRIKMVKEERGFRSDGEALEWMILGGVGEREAANETKTVIEKDDKRARFEALKLALSGKPKMDLVESVDRPLSETPSAPFAFSVDGEEHRVLQLGKRLGIYYTGGGEQVFTRYLKEGELEQLWEKRIK